MNGTDEPRFRLGLARATLAWEQIWPALWPATGIAGLFIAIALFNVLPSLGGWLHALILLLFAVAFGTAVWYGVRRIRLPDGAAALRRLERDSGLTHRPLAALRDTLAGGSDPASAELWRLYQERARQRMRDLKVRLPHPNLAARDPWALRAAVGLILFVAGFGTWGDWGPRIGAAFTPHLDSSASAATASLDVWVTPPEYTGLPPIFLRTGQPAPQAAKAGEPAHTPHAIPVPIGSVLLARVTGGSGVPALTANGASSAFEQVDQASYQITEPVTRGGTIAVEQRGRTLGSWPITVVPDTAPIIALPTPPAAGERGALRLEYEARDDYGVVTVTGAVRLSGDVAEPGIDRTPVELQLPLPGVRPKTARSTSFHDLTPHPWAGLPVTLRLSATDGAG
jgi:uncharacterized protein (TIGR02302 family)